MIFPKLSRLSRRHLLQGLGAGAALSPFVPLLEARGQTAALPKRLIFFYSSNGTIYERWKPSMSGGELVLSDILQPLDPFKDKLLVVGGLRYQVEIEKGQLGGGHEGGQTSCLTGTPSKKVDATQASAGLATGPSVDQHLAKVLGYRTALCGIRVDDYSDTIACTSYAGPLQPLKPNNNPYQVFGDLFGSFMLPGEQVDPVQAQRLADRRSVIDLVRTDLNQLKKSLGSAELAKLDAHLEGIRQLELGLDATRSPSALDACKKTALGVPLDADVNDNIPALGSHVMDMVVDAMACDIIRGASIQFGRAGANHRFTWLGDKFNQNPAYVPGKDETEGIHSFAHDEHNPSSRDGLVGMNAWYAQQVASLLGRLSSIQEGDGTMLDNTLVVWFNELGKGSSHELIETPWVLAGNLAGHYKTGQFLDFPDQPHNRLLLSLCHAMGQPELTSFGDPDYCVGGALPGLSA